MSAPEMIDGPTIPQLAKKLGLPRRTLFGRLLALHAADRAKDAAAFEPWLYRYADGGKWRVNLPRLRKAHPEVFGVPTNEELDARLRRVERRQDTLETGQRAILERVRAHERGHVGG